MSWTDQPNSAGMPTDNPNPVLNLPSSSAPNFSTAAAANAANGGAGYYPASYGADSPLAGYTQTAAYYASQAAAGGAGSTRLAAMTMNIGSGAGQISVVDYLKEASLAELLTAIKCGKLNALQCLCDPFMREAARVLDERFSRREQAALFDTMCGCAVAQPTVTPIPTTPSNPAVPAVFNPAPSPAPTPAPTPACSTALPPQGSLTNG